MLLAFIIAIVGAIIFGIIGYCEFEDIADGVVKFLLGFVVCLILGFAVGLAVSGVYWDDDTNYHTEIKTYKLEEYNTGNKDDDYYVCINNVGGKLQTNLQYRDEDRTPQVLHLQYNVEYAYNKTYTPSIKVLRYIPNECSIWIYKSLAQRKPNEYTIMLPDSSVIYYSQK